MAKLNLHVNSERKVIKANNREDSVYEIYKDSVDGKEIFKESISSSKPFLDFEAEYSLADTPASAKPYNHMLINNLDSFKFKDGLGNYHQIKFFDDAAARAVDFKAMMSLQGNSDFDKALNDNLFVKSDTVEYQELSSNFDFISEFVL